MRAGDELTRALVTARVKEQERYGDSPAGMRATAAALRQSAAEMMDSNDREAMLRVAAGFEQRADTAYRRPR